MWFLVFGAGPFNLCRVMSLALAGGCKRLVLHLLIMHNTPKNSGTSFLLLPDGGIVDMPVSTQ